MSEQTIEMQVVKMNKDSWPDSEMRTETIVVKKVIDGLSRVFCENGIPPPLEEDLIKLVETAIDEQNKCSDQVAAFIGMKKG